MTKKGQDLFDQYINTAVKILSVIVTLCKAYPVAIRQHGSIIADQAIRLLQITPGRIVNVRRDLYVNLKQMLPGDFRSFFQRHLDQLLDEDVLIGRGLSAQETLRNHAFSLLADYIHLSRNELTAMQLAKAVHLFIKNLQDPYLALSTQSMCCKLLLTFADMISRRTDSASMKSRDLLLHILSAFVTKLGSVAVGSVPRILDKLLTPTTEPTAAPISDDDQTDTAVKMDTAPDDAVEPAPAAEQDSIVGSVIPFATSAASDWVIDNVREMRTLLRSLMQNLATVVYGIMKHSNQSNPSGSRWLNAEEIPLFVNLLRNGVLAMDLLKLGLDGKPRWLDCN